MSVLGSNRPASSKAILAYCSLCLCCSAWMRLQGAWSCRRSRKEASGEPDGRANRGKSQGNQPHGGDFSFSPSRACRGGVLACDDPSLVALQQRTQGVLCFSARALAARVGMFFVRRRQERRSLVVPGEPRNVKRFSLFFRLFVVVELSARANLITSLFLF